MKMKKLLALVLSAIMAVSMLTACGGGSKSGSLDLSEVKDTVAEAGVSVKVSSNNELTSAVRAVASVLKQNNTFDSQTAIDEIQKRITTKSGSNVIETATAIVLSDAEIRAGDDGSEYGLGFINTPEGVAAGVIIMMDRLVSASGYTGDIMYSASATTVEADNGTLYWVIGVKVTVDMN